MYVAWKKMHPEEIEFLLFWKNSCMPVEINMNEFCPSIATHSPNTGPDKSNFFFLLLDAQSPPRIFQRFLLRKCRLDKYLLQNPKDFPCQPKQSLRFLALQHHGNTFIKITEFTYAATYSPDLYEIEFKFSHFCGEFLHLHM